MKAFNTLFILSLSFFLSHKATNAAPIPVLGVSDARDQIHDALDEYESKASGMTSKFGTFRSRMDDLEHRVAVMEQKKEQEQKKHNEPRGTVLDTIGGPYKSMSSAANNLGSLPQALENSYTSSGPGTNSLLASSSSNVATLAKRVDAAANIDQTDLAPIGQLDQLGTATNGLSNAVPAVPVNLNSS
ncbi:hypothetical protein BJ912DRAFT_994033 [Pholiota molesta]|nr:hypothetical protein BJ912DRAFT_994033 [Pholiota molesta]